MKDATKAVLAGCGIVRKGPLTPWERLKLIAFANTSADEIGIAEQQVAKLRDGIAQLEELQGKCERGEITEDEAREQSKKIEKLMSEDQLNTEIGKKVIQNTKNNVQQQRDFVDEVQNSKMALELAVSTFRKSTLDFIDEMGKYLTDIRQTKVALGSETRQLISQCQDVRNFFISPEHEQEVKRLKEFVEVCERLKALKDSGFLDNVADTILRLETQR